MLIVLSPAKTMDMKIGHSISCSTQPLFLANANELVNCMRQYSIEELERLLKVSKVLAEENFRRYQEFHLPSTLSKQALLAYNGSVFKEIKANTFSEADWIYVQDHLRIVSVLYGLLRPLDLIKAYRLIYPIKLKGLELKNLYDYWLPKLTSSLIHDVRQAGGILVNLASLDIWDAFQRNEICKEVRIITPEFQEFRNGKYETVRTYAKQARGAMTRYILLNRIESPEGLLNFKWQGFQFNEKISETEKYIFTRTK